MDSARSFLHFIGRRYYTLAQFLREAETHRITRRISRRELARLRFGDVVYLAIRDGKTPVCFGKFVVSTVSGLSDAEVAAAASLWELRCVDIGGDMIERECGEYQAGATFQLVGSDVSIERLLEACESVPENDRGKWMVGGTLIKTERVRFASMTGRLGRGFRPFDADSFSAAVARATPPKRVKGFFYVGKDAPPSNVHYLDAERARRVQTTYGYRGKK